VEVLVEGPSKNAVKQEPSDGPLQLTGRTTSDHIVVFEGNARLIGQTVAVTIDEATAFTLFGSVVTRERVGVGRYAQALLLDERADQQTVGRLSRIPLPLVP